MLATGRFRIYSMYEHGSRQIEVQTVGGDIMSKDRSKYIEDVGQHSFSRLPILSLFLDVGLACYVGLFKRLLCEIPCSFS